MTTWEAIKIASVIAAIGLPVALWTNRWDLALILMALVPLSPLIYLNERRKERRRREKGDKPVLPTADAPGRVPVPEPQSSKPCCDEPDLVHVGRLKDTDQVPCRACGTGRLRIVESAIA